MTAEVRAIGLLGPGIGSWAHGRTVLRGAALYQPQLTVIPASMALPPAERRRAIRTVNLALAVGHEATVGVDIDLTKLCTVFASSGADCTNCHELLETLATADRQVSPTRFHNSVHNVAAGYWSIATRDTASYTMVSAYDGSFSAGLVEAFSLVTSLRHSVLLIAYDMDYPGPLREVRPIPDAFGVALLLQPSLGSGTMAQLSLSFSDESPAEMHRPELESLRLSAPAARAMPLLELLAGGRAGVVRLEYLDNLSLSVTVTPCD